MPLISIVNYTKIGRVIFSKVFNFLPTCLNSSRTACTKYLSSTIKANFATINM